MVGTKPETSNFQPKTYHLEKEEVTGKKQERYFCSGGFYQKYL